MTRVFAIALVLGAFVQDEMVDNPDYQSWAKQKVGAWVKYTRETNMGAMKMTHETTRTLKELTPEKAVIEEKTTMNMNGEPKETVLTIPQPAKIKKGTTTDGAKMEIVKEGDEELEVKGKKLKCHWVEMKLTGKNASTMKVWRSDEVIGGAVKVEFRADEASKMTMTMKIVDWKAGE